MGVFQVVFFAIIAFVLFFSLFFKSKEEFLTRYLVYFMVMSFFFHLIFQSKSVVWMVLFLFCVVGIILYLDSSLIKKSVQILSMLIFVSLFRVPSGTTEFGSYLKEEHGIYCAGIECLQVSENEDVPGMKSERSAIQSYHLASYFFWAKGELETDSISLKAFNVMGFWLPERGSN
ncbi:hypothetical protein [Sporosarcina sp. ZBG7A]|uniref:hypothetical protein n=1 Tax=Sporosarcina sp. ZBG7A TaxID=1582223 RepID=UPI00057AB40A|nr:hypothetical protein [Sporosarcina sp. ZBG7A]